MANFDSNRFASNNQEYATPWDLFNKINAEFNFTLDICANESNHKVVNYFTEEQDALSQDWIGTCWMNPPYVDMKKWVIRAYQQSEIHGSTIVCLIPARTNTGWWHEYCMKGEIRFLKGRPKFEGCQHGLPQPLALVIFGPEYKNQYVGFDIRSYKYHRIKIRKNR